MDKKSELIVNYIDSLTKWEKVVCSCDPITESRPANMTDMELCGSITLNPYISEGNLETIPEIKDNIELRNKIEGQTWRTQKVLSKLEIQPIIDYHDDLILRIQSILLDVIDSPKSISKNIDRIVDSINKYSERCFNLAFRIGKSTEEDFDATEALKSYKCLNSEWTKDQISRENHTNSDHYKSLAKLIRTMMDKKVPIDIINLITSTKTYHATLNFYQHPVGIPSLFHILPYTTAIYCREKVKKKRDLEINTKNIDDKSDIMKIFETNFLKNLKLIKSFESLNQDSDDEQSQDEDEQLDEVDQLHPETIQVEQVDELFEDDDVPNKQSTIKTTSKKPEKEAEHMVPEVPKLSSSDSDTQPVGTGRFNQIKWRKERSKIDDLNFETTQMGKANTKIIKTSETNRGVFITDCDSFRHDDLIAQSIEEVKRLEKLKVLPIYQSHQTRFKTREIYTNTIHSTELHDDDIIINLNNSFRSYRYLLTIHESTKDLIFTEIVKRRWDRMS